MCEGRRPKARFTPRRVPSVLSGGARRVREGHQKAPEGHGLKASFTSRRVPSVPSGGARGPRAEGKLHPPKGTMCAFGGPKGAGRLPRTASPGEAPCVQGLSIRRYPARSEGGEASVDWAYLPDGLGPGRSTMDRMLRTGEGKAPTAPTSIGFFNG